MSPANSRGPASPSRPGRRAPWRRAAHRGGRAHRGTADPPRHGRVLALIVALGVADIIFALDSHSGRVRLTRDPLLVSSANVFALIGLLHLYFLVAGLSHG